MILRQDALVKRLQEGAALMKCNELEGDPLVVNPLPDFDSRFAQNSAAIDLRLGTWFLSFKRDHSEALKIGAFNSEEESSSITKSEYVPFHRSYFLHPNSFVLAVTLEWIRLPKDLAGYVIGKSSWGRRGLIIATAVGVHPGFSGCLTLELCNLGEVPIEIVPGVRICQLFLHTVKIGDIEPNVNLTDLINPKAQGDPEEIFSAFSGSRLPRLGHIKPDRVARALRDPLPHAD